MFQKIKIALLVCLPGTFFAQDFKQDIKTIVTGFDTSSSVSLEVKVNAYQKKGGKLLYSTTCELERNHKNTYSKLDDMEFINCDGYQLQLDHTEKYLYVFKHKKTKSPNFDVDVKSLKKFFEQETKGEKQSKMKSSLVSDNNGVKTYRLTGLDDLTEVIIELDVKNKKLKKITYNYLKESSYSGQYIVLDYTKFNTEKGDFPFDLKQYFTFSNGKYVANTKYKHYKLITE